MMTKEAQKLNERLMDAWAKGGPDAVIKAAVLYCDEMDAALKAEQERCREVKELLAYQQILWRKDSDVLKAERKFVQESAGWLRVIWPELICLFAPDESECVPDQCRKHGVQRFLARFAEARRGKA